MGTASRIVAVTARQIYSDRGHPGVEATVTTQNGAKGIAVATAGTSVGKHEAKFAQGGDKRWGQLGVYSAVDNVNQIIGPAIMGMDATNQLAVDDVIIKLDGTPDKSKLGANATAAVSAAVLKAAAASLDIPLYQHIGGVHACILPTPGVLTFLGSRKYGGGERSGVKPSYSAICYGFDTFSEASFAAWRINDEFRRMILDRYNVDSRPGHYLIVSPGHVKHDRELWDLMVETVEKLGYAGRVGFQVDVAAATYYRPEKDRFVGLFSAGEKTRDELIALYRDMVKNYPFVILEDPLDEDDYEGHAILTRELGIQVVGDDLFTTNPVRVQKGIDAHAGNAVLLKVNQIGTITESFDMVELAYRHGYGVMPCDSRGEGVAIADYAVGLKTGHLREGAIGPVGNRLLQIEAELGSRAVFLGRKGFKP